MNITWRLFVSDTERRFEDSGKLVRKVAERIGVKKLGLSAIKASANGVPAAYLGKVFFY